MMNYQILVGRIATVPETTPTTNSVVTKFKLITSKWVKGKEETQTHYIVAWGAGLEKFFNDVVAKGDAIGFIGEPVERKVESRDGGPAKYFREVVIGQNTEISIITRAQANRRPRPEGDGA